MHEKKSGRSDWHQAAGKHRNYTRKSTGLGERIKTLIGTAAVWGLLPATLALWLTHAEGEADE